jgi:hypothetical protein
MAGRKHRFSVLYDIGPWRVLKIDSLGYVAQEQKTPVIIDPSKRRVIATG